MDLTAGVFILPRFSRPPKYMEFISGVVGRKGWIPCRESLCGNVTWGGVFCRVCWMQQTGWETRLLWGKRRSRSG